MQQVVGNGGGHVVGVVTIVGGSGVGIVVGVVTLLTAGAIAATSVLALTNRMTVWEVLRVFCLETNNMLKELN